jgi:hypothetical protein
LAELVRMVVHLLLVMSKLGSLTDGKGKGNGMTSVLRVKNKSPR